MRRPSKSASLAEDILAIRAALDGASASARERTLKTLERLTERLALAESERDMALGEFSLVQLLHKIKIECKLDCIQSKNKVSSSISQRYSLFL